MQVDLLRQFLVRQHGRIGDVDFDQLLHVAADVHRREDHRFLSRLGFVADTVLHLIDEVACRRRIECKETSTGCLADRFADRLFGVRVQQVDRECVLTGAVLVADVALQAGTYVFDKQDGVLLLLAPFDERLQNRPQVAIETPS